VAYRRFYLVMDFWFPGTIAALATASLMLIAFPPQSGRAWLCVFAVLSWLFDVAENITHFQMAGSYPNLSSVSVKFGPFYPREVGICDYASPDRFDWARSSVHPRVVIERSRFSPGCGHASASALVDAFLVTRRRFIQWLQ
jgi:hypothetical protein